MSPLNSQLFFPGRLRCSSPARVLSYKTFSYGFIFNKTHNPHATRVRHLLFSYRCSPLRFAILSHCFTSHEPFSFNLHMTPAGRLTFHAYTPGDSTLDPLSCHLVSLPEAGIA